jgi:hypothetical protein
MAFTASFTVGRSLSCGTLVITDTSDYGSESKGTFTSRALYIYLSDGSTMIANGTITTTPTAINFSFASYPSDSIEIPLSSDYGFNIVMALTSSNPQGGSTYTAQTVAASLCYIPQFAQSMQQGVQAQGALINDTNYQNNLSKIYLEISNAENSATYSVLASIQNAIDRAYVLINNQNLYF